jgi:RecA/RadA recombinase
MDQQSNPMQQQTDELLPWSLEFLLLHIVRVPQVFDIARTELTPEMLSLPSEIYYQHIWREILKHYEKHGRLPARETLGTAILVALDTDSAVTADPATAAMIRANASELVNYMYDTQKTSKDDLEPAAALEVLRRVLVARGPEADMRRAVANAPFGRIVNLPEIVSKAQQRIQDIESLGRLTANEESSYPIKWSSASRPRWPTGVDFVDRIMEGGSSPGDCNVLIGPTGGGKTTLAMQLAASTARLQFQAARRPGSDEPGLVVFVSYEDSLEMMQIRAGSYGAHVLKNRLRDLKDDSELSTAGNLQDYEREMYARDGQTSDMLGERERLEQIRPWFSKHLALVDFHDPSQGGRGHVAEVRQKLTALQDKRGLPIRMVVLDWAGNLVMNYLVAQKGYHDGAGMALELQNLVNRAKHEIAAPFNCTVWIPHQLKGAACKGLPARFPHHAESQWCSMFADHAWFAFVLGTKDKEHNVLQFGATKTRHGETPPPTILKLDGAMCRMVDVSKHYVVDGVSHQLVPRVDVSRFHEDLQGTSPGVDANQM